MPLTKKQIRQMIDSGLPAWAIGVILAAWAGVSRKKIEKMLGGHGDYIDLLIDHGILVTERGRIKLNYKFAEKIGLKTVVERDSRVKEILVYYAKLWKQQYGKLPVMRWAKWGKNIKDILRQLDKEYTPEESLAQFKTAIAGYFNDDSEYVRNAKHSFDLFIASFNKYLIGFEVGGYEDFRGGFV